VSQILSNLQQAVVDSDGHRVRSLFNRFLPEAAITETSHAADLPEVRNEKSFSATSNLNPAENG
jgi:hypothetical protein